MHKFMSFRYEPSSELRDEIGGFVVQVLQAAESTVKSLDAARRRALSPPVEPFPALEPFDESEGRDMDETEGRAVADSAGAFGDGVYGALGGGAGRRLLASSASYRMRTRRMLISRVSAATDGALSSRTVTSAPQKQ